MHLQFFFCVAKMDCVYQCDILDFNCVFLCSSFDRAAVVTKGKPGPPGAQVNKPLFIFDSFSSVQPCLTRAFVVTKKHYSPIRPWKINVCSQSAEIVCQLAS